MLGCIVFKFLLVLQTLHHLFIFYSADEPLLFYCSIPHQDPMSVLFVDERMKDDIYIYGIYDVSKLAKSELDVFKLSIYGPNFRKTLSLRLKKIPDGNKESYLFYFEDFNNGY